MTNAPTNNAPQAVGYYSGNPKFELSPSVRVIKAGWNLDTLHELHDPCRFPNHSPKDRAALSLLIRVAHVELISHLASEGF
jgi:hypothetical protein